MVKKYGNYEVDLKEGFVRLQLSDSFEYLISQEIFDSKEDAIRASKAFTIGFEHNQYYISNTIKELLSL